MRSLWRVLRDVCELATTMDGFRPHTNRDPSRDRRLAGKPRIKARRSR